MKTLIVYGTKYGCTEECAVRLKKEIAGEVDLYNVRGAKDINLSDYNSIIIGGSIYMGKIQKEVSEFCSKQLDVLKNKKVGLFICCMRDGDVAKEELNNAFPKELIDNAIVRESFGGEFIFKKMNFMDKLIVKKVSKIDKDTSSISVDSINRFAKLMNNA